MATADDIQLDESEPAIIGRNAKDGLVDFMSKLDLSHGGDTWGLVGLRLLAFFSSKDVLRRLGMFLRCSQNSTKQHRRTNKS